MVYKPTYNWGAPYCKDVQCIFLSGYHAHSCWLKRPNNGPVVRIKTPFGHLRLDALHRLFRHFRPPRGAGWTPETVGEFGEKHGVVVVEVTSLPLSSHAFFGLETKFRVGNCDKLDASTFEVANNAKVVVIKIVVLGSAKHWIDTWVSNKPPLVGDFNLSPKSRLIEQSLEWGVVEKR